MHFNTFGIDVFSKFFVRIANIDQLREVIENSAYQKEKKLVLGGGSNILFTRDFEGFVLKNDIMGFDVVSEDENNIVIKAGAGENWHEFVKKNVSAGYGGLENLSLIPGNVGASPMQNIGAYGVEVKDVVEAVECIDLKSGEIEIFNASMCEFGYRSSVFKTKLAGQKFIHSVSFRLNKKSKPNTSYGAIENELEKLGLPATIQNVSQAVINIRRSKLPDPTEIGNAGSFFKNPEISAEQAEKLKINYPDCPLYPVENGHFKAAAGWLIEKAGWKGKIIKNYGVHSKQALVLVNYGGSKGSDILDLAREIQQNILSRFGIHLEMEVNIL